MHKGRPFKKYNRTTGMAILNSEDLELYRLEKEEMINKTKHFLINNIKKNNELLNKYLLLVEKLNCRYFANANNILLEELLKDGFNNELIDNLINECWNDSVVIEYKKRKEIIEESCKRSYYLKRRFKKEG